MDYSKMSNSKLLLICNDLGLKNCSRLKKAELVNLIMNNHTCLPQQKHKFVDLFCGIGGFHQALVRNENFECAMACDIDEKCRDVYFQNYGIRPEKDIKNINEKNIPDFDILTAGFPCQTFSNAGKKGNMEDKRGQLFEDILRIAKEKKPKLMFLENVKHIKKIDNGKTFEHIIKRINETGYFVKDKETIFELSPHELGIPQQRERVIFVCIRNDIYDEEKKLVFNAPKIDIDISKILETDQNVTRKYRISKEIEDVLNIWDKMINEIDTGETLSPTILCNEFQKQYTSDEYQSLVPWKQDYIKKNKPLYQKYKSKWDSWLLENIDTLRKREIYCKLEWQVGKKKPNDSIWNYFIQFRQSGIRVKKTHYFPTLVAIVQTPIFAKEKRYITPRECARLQSFPDSFIMHKNDNIAYKQFGNAVNVDVVSYIMNKVLRLYDFI
jgi:DNA (cytosine-5)-methyltransferase 1